MADLLKIRKDTAANWQQNNPILQAGEPGYETDTNSLKIGDGVTAWNGLKYFQTDMLLETVASGTTTLNAAINRYYNFSGTVGTLTVTLPAVTGATKAQGITFMLQTSSNPDVTFSTADGSTIDEQKDFAIEADSKYEITALWNGSKWTITLIIYQ